MSATQKILVFFRFKWLAPVMVIVVVLCLAAAMFGMMKARLAASIYAQRLTKLSSEFAALQERYNAAVKRSAITELEVKDGKLYVRIRTSEGILKKIPVACDPAKEIYVDYIIHDSRLWIRRVFDSETPPEQATVIDPSWAHVDWKDQHVAYGKCVYRKLEEGVWIITVTGNGSLGLTKNDHHPSDTPLVAPPSIEEFRESVKEAEEAAGKLTFWDVIRVSFGPKNH